MLTALVLGTTLLAFLAFAFPKSANGAAKWYGVAVALAGLVLLELMDPAAFPPDESARWLSYPFASNFHLGMGGVSYALVQLLATVTVCALLATNVPRQRNFVGLMLLLEATMLGLFLAKDLLLFALLWDAMLIPVFLLMIGWSVHPATAWRYLIYNVAGGLLLLLGTATYGVIYGTTDVIGKGQVTPISDAWAPWILAAFAVAFLVKTPVFPFHTWMPDTYAELPSPVAAVVSSVQSKAGLYGFIAIGLPLFTAWTHEFATVMIVLGTIGLLYGAVIALVADDAKKVVAYSSLSHLGLILIAIFVFNDYALRGAVVYIVAHGFFSAAMFLVIGYVETREETRLVSRIGGLARGSPILAGAMAIAALAALGLPGLAGFAGELFILTGVYQAGYAWLAALALVAIVLAAAYMLRVYQGFMHGPEQADLPQRPDLRPLEIVAVAPLFLALVLLGVNPGPVANYPDQAYTMLAEKR
ncbi:MAG: NADH-quinone oxidoreductase subunit M [Candidatus Eremiobacteraeota bacterium]|nr:NADH-quinone oxidoreductase subunit M [Candidatus Eremiobacteraeota bacterium]